MKCPNCDNLLASGAKFCVRCGHPAPGSIDLAPAKDMFPSKSRMPLRGKLFVLAALLGPALLVAGRFNPRFAVLGLALIGGLVLLLILGEFF